MRSCIANIRVEQSMIAARPAAVSPSTAAHFQSTYFGQHGHHRWLDQLYHLSVRAACIGGNQHDSHWIVDGYRGDRFCSLTLAREATSSCRSADCSLIRVAYICKNSSNQIKCSQQGAFGLAGCDGIGWLPTKVNCYRFVVITLISLWRLACFQHERPYRLAVLTALTLYSRCPQCLLLYVVVSAGLVGAMAWGCHDGPMTRSHPTHLIVG